MAAPLLVVGLGNPGPNYAKTRHNLGFVVADLLAERIGSKFKVHKRSGAEVVTGRLGGRSIVLAKPRTYMNESGRQVGPLAKFYSVPPADIVVVHDELDIEFGRIRLKFGGGVAGHNGLRSVSAALGTKDFQRVRVGIGRPPGAFAEVIGKLGGRLPLAATCSGVSCISWLSKRSSLPETRFVAVRISRGARSAGGRVKFSGLSFSKLTCFCSVPRSGLVS